MQTSPTAPPAAASAVTDALADIATVMGTIGRALPISTALPRPEAAEKLVAEPAGLPKLLPTAVPHTCPVRATTVADRVRPPVVDCRWPLWHLAPEEPAR